MHLDDFPRVPLGFLPTPIEDMPRLGAEIGVALSCKRDDFTGFGVGGNKIRKIEYLMAEAMAEGANVLITTGGHQSNHARVVAAAAARFGMRSVLVLRGNAPSSFQGNLLLDRLFGAEVEFLDPDAYFDLIAGRMQAHADAASAKGEVPFIIPLGGATAVGALGYVRAVQEMAEQHRQQKRSPPDAIVVPAGSGGTLAGLVVGCHLHWPKTRVIGISVSRDARWFQERVAEMASGCLALLGGGRSWSPEEILVSDEYVGTRYGVPSPDGNEAVRQAARLEGLLLDPIYTGKAMAGLTGLVRSGVLARGSAVLFVHCGGSPAIYPFSESVLGSDSSA
ncbi:D-cysteine desulfhydrase family protein [Acetobacteraceae bacterium KSS8]|uniref:D-cysteine desulfhydrase family protein n=1 Tax=Endosaccharibacter trunci TaxID=2812733 RepID=A0ABT1W9N7_9PROT|nr:D-cysteine desulfhydrase family protein [Acetobacteraceae bacterium KSS8]